MRLINTDTGRFEEFFDSQRPQYAVLSHTWGSEETSYHDFLFLTSDLPANTIGAVQALLRNPKKDSEGVRKVQACCRLAQSRGVKWVWIDSCCIDKSSSAELSEAINSMWSWYRDAVECYVALADVSVAAGPSFTAEAMRAFGSARWFTRGWTLQELLAPRKVLFCNREWEILAEKAQIAAELAAITRIPLVFLDGTYDASNGRLCSVAMKMSWLSRRQTTRVEDMAYCMLGLFDVHMPLIYGEGRKAFMRLQLEIIKKSDDDSIYAWTADVGRSGLLATWPTAFSHSGNIVQIVFPEDHTPWVPPVMTPLGLEMRGRYHRYDPHQREIDERHEVQTITTALPTGNVGGMVMHCGPCAPNDIPITQQWSRQHKGRAMYILLERFGATWQRSNCRQLDFQDYKMYEPSPWDSYVINYIEQEGL